MAWCPPNTQGFLGECCETPSGDWKVFASMFLLGQNLARLTETESLLQVLLDSQPDTGIGSVTLTYDVGLNPIPGQVTGAQVFNAGALVLHQLSGTFGNGIVVARAKGTRIVNGANYCVYFFRQRVIENFFQPREQMSCEIVANTNFVSRTVHPPPIGTLDPSNPIGFRSGVIYNTIVLRPGEATINPRPPCCGA